MDSKIFWRGNDPENKGAITRLTLCADMDHTIRIRQEFPFKEDARTTISNYRDLDLNQLRSLDKRLPKFAEKILEENKKHLKRTKKTIEETKEAKAKSWYDFLLIKK